MLVSTLVAASGRAPAARVTGEALVVRLRPNSFTPSTIELPVGRNVLMIDDAPIPHFIRDGQWLSTGAAQTDREPGAPAVNLTITNGAIQVGPFWKAGVLSPLLHRSSRHESDPEGSMNAGKAITAKALLEATTVAC